VSCCPQCTTDTSFRSFGPIRYAKVTIDHATGRSRGTGFVCFWNKEHADAAIDEAARVAMETGTAAPGKAGGERKNPFALPSVLTADPSSSLASRLVLHGRTLNVSRAVTRETAGHLAEDNQRAREKGDKRNTYLMREGVVFPNSPAAAALPASEVEKRQAAFGARKALLRSNPSLYISKTRLSVRQLPLFVTDRGLKRLGIHAVRAFDDEVKAGTREGLSRIEADDDTLSPALEGRKLKKGERQTAVVQSKVVRQNEKVDPLTGRGRSKGYGFLELRSHKEALKVLRWANNNPAVGPLLAEWWAGELADIRERAQKELVAVREGKEVKEGKESAEELDARLKKLDARVAEGEDRTGGGMRGGKTLMIEFSVENVQVVRRRVEKIAGPKREREPKDKGKRKAEDSDDERDAKRPRRDGKSGKPAHRRESGRRDDKKGKGKDKKEPKPKAEKTDEPRGIEKLGSHLGSLIGRKRKQRKGGK
jgi:nucleolar protein 4